MFPLTKQHFNELAAFHAPHCISIFIPTHRAGMEVNRRADEILLKNQLKALSSELETYGLSQLDIKNYLQPALQLLENSAFWNELSDGLAIYLGKDFFEYHVLPVRFETFTYIADHFYLKPLAPLFTGDGRFFILAISQNEVQFFEATRHSITDVKIEDLTPANMEAAVGRDYEQRSLQFHSAQSGQGRAIFHGRGEGKDDEKEEIKQYLKAINDGLMEMLHDEDAPMVVACVDYYFPIYQEVNDYPLLYSKHISGNPDHDDPGLLHEKAWDVIAPYFQQERNKHMQEFQELAATQRVSTQLEDILPAAINGKIETLFLQNRSDAYGVFDPQTQEIRWDKEKHLNNASLMNLAAVKTFEQGGKVYLLEPEEMPVEGTQANAVFRY